MKTHRPDLGVCSELHRHAVDGEEQTLKVSELWESELEQPGGVVKHCAIRVRVACKGI